MQVVRLRHVERYVVLVPELIARQIERDVAEHGLEGEVAQVKVAIPVHLVIALHRDLRAVRTELVFLGRRKERRQEHMNKHTNMHTHTHKYKYKEREKGEGE